MTVPPKPLPDRISKLLDAMRPSALNGMPIGELMDDFNTARRLNLGPVPEISSLHGAELLVEMRIRRWMHDERKADKHLVPPKK